MDPLGVDELDQVAELHFTLELMGSAPRSWSWQPATGQVRLLSSGSLAFRLGQPQTPEQSAADNLFLQDTFWLAPQLHVRWAGPDATLLDQGPALFLSRPVHRYELRYAPTAGGYTPGDAHDLYTDASGRLVGWSYRPSGGDAALTVALEQYVQVGPLALATVRRSAEGNVCATVRELGWLRSGVNVAVSPGDAQGFLHVSPTGCSLQSEPVPHRTPTGSPPASPLAEPATSFAQSLSVRDGAGPVEQHRWSQEQLAFEDSSWLSRWGLLRCDFQALDTAALRRVLARSTPLERGAILTLLLEWTLSEIPLPRGSAPVLRKVRGEALTCAATGQCEALYGWLDQRR